MGCGNSVDISYKKVDSNIWRGKLEVEVKNASLHEDVQFIGKQDPYCKLRFGRQEKQTKVNDDGGQFPKWNETFEFIRTDEDDYVHVEIWDQNIIKDAFIAEGGFSLTKVRKGQNLKLDQECNLYGQGKRMGVLNISIKFQLDPGCEKHPEVLAPDTTGKFIIWPKSATLQRDASGWFEDIQPLCVIRLGDSECATAVDSKGKMNPKWDEQHILIRDEIQRDTLMVEIKTFSESSENNPLVGVGFLPFTPALTREKIEKTVPIYHNGKLAGSVTVQYEFDSDNDAKYDQEGKSKQEANKSSQNKVNIQQKKLQPNANIKQAGNYIVVQPQIIYANQPGVLQTRIVKDTLNTNESLSVNQYLWSQNGQYYLIVQSDDNLVLYRAHQNFVMKGDPQWASNTVGQKGNSTLVMQNDGNLTLYASGNPLWSSGTWKKGIGPYRCTVQNNGALVLYDSTNQPIWTTNN